MSGEKRLSRSNHPRDKTPPSKETLDKKKPGDEPGFSILPPVIVVIKAGSSPPSDKTRQNDQAGKEKPSDRVGG